MVYCPYCKDYRHNGDKFCAKCGTILDCPECDKYRSLNARFCAKCGRRLIPSYIYKPEKNKESPTLWIGIFAASLALIFLFIGAIALYYYATDVLGYLADKTYGLILLIPYPYVFVQLSEVELQLYWVFLIAVLTLSFIQLACEIYSKYRDGKKKGGIAIVQDTSIYWMGLLWPSTIFLQMVLMFIVIMISGVNLTSPSIGADTYASMFTLANAGVWEEISTRVLIIGLPLGIVALLSGKKQSWRYLLGGFGVSKASMISIIIAALVFGYAHETGWGFAKVIPAFIFGMAAGYLYAKYGLYAAILMHFVNDYLMAFVWLGGSDLVSTIMYLTLIGLGVISTVVLAIKGIPFVKTFKDRPFFPDSFALDDEDKPLQ